MHRTRTFVARMRREPFGGPLDRTDPTDTEGRAPLLVSEGIVPAGRIDASTGS